jgi:hypothetical protein
MSKILGSIFRSKIAAIKNLVTKKNEPKSEKQAATDLESGRQRLNH